jgi:leader peptidase (prepilin peptidase) / N-methyltransferase
MAAGIPIGLGVVLSTLFGGVIGSFLNVVAWRLPRDKSVAAGRSHCPGCDSAIRAYDNIPVLSWLLLRGRCRDCKMRISWRYPAVEAGTAALCAAVAFAEWDHPARMWLGLVLVLLLVPITLIDLEHQLIPSKIVRPGAVAALALVLLLDRGNLLEHVIAGAAAYALFDVVAFLRPGGMGGGDVRLAGMLGLFLGTAVVPALFIAFLSGSLVGGVVLARRGIADGRKTKVPFGPFLALGGAVAIFAGTAIVGWYTTRFL